MKLSTSNKFDVSQIADTNSFQDLEPFFDYINSFVSDVVQGFNKKISFADNINYTPLPLTVQHGVPINIGNYSPIGVFITSETPFSYYELDTNNDSTKNLTLRFKTPQNVFAKSAVWQMGNVIKYKVLDASPYSVGDVAAVAQFGLASNNGYFLIVDIDEENDYLYVLNRKRGDATDDENRTGFVGVTLAKYRITAGIING